MISPKEDPVGIEIVDKLKDLGFDYIELSISHMTSLAAGAFADLVKRMEGAGIVCEACNNFFPHTIRLTGPDADLPKALEHAKAACERAARLGVEVIVFGSSGAKNVPAGFPHDKAWRQIIELLQVLGPVAAAHGITIAIEHLNRKESNIVTLAGEGLRLAREVGHPNIQLLIDYYHLRLENEDFAILHEARPSIRHVHFAELGQRLFPVEPDDDYVRFFETLHRIQYDGRLSIEGYTSNFISDARRSLTNLKAIAERVGY